MFRMFLQVGIPRQTGPHVEVAEAGIVYETVGNSPCVVPGGLHPERGRSYSPGSYAEPSQPMKSWHPSNASAKGHSASMIKVDRNF